jgi:hypothetical protein
MIAAGPIASTAIASVPDALLNKLSASFVGTVTYQALPFSPYLQLVNQPGQRVLYVVELNLRAVR